MSLEIGMEGPDHADTPMPDGLFERFVSARSNHGDAPQDDFDAPSNMASVSTTGTYSITTSASSSYYTSSLSSVGSHQLNAMDGIRSGTYLAKDDSPRHRQQARRHHHRPRRIGGSNTSNTHDNESAKTRRPKKRRSDGSRTPLMVKLCSAHADKISTATEEEADEDDGTSLFNGFITDGSSLPSHKSNPHSSPSVADDGVPSGGTADEMMRGISDLDLGAFLAGGASAATSLIAEGDVVVSSEEVISPPQPPYEGAIPQYSATDNEGFMLENEDGTDSGQVGSLFTVLSEEETAPYSYGGRRCIPNPFKGRKGMGKLAPMSERQRLASLQPQGVPAENSPSLLSSSSSLLIERPSYTSARSQHKQSIRSPPVSSHVGSSAAPSYSNVAPESHEGPKGVCEVLPSPTKKQPSAKSSSGGDRKPNPLLLFYQNDCDADEEELNFKAKTQRRRRPLVEEDESGYSRDNGSYDTISPYVGRLLPRKVAESSPVDIEPINDFPNSNRVFEDAFRPDNPQWLGHHNAHCFVPYEAPPAPPSDLENSPSYARRLESMQQEIKSDQPYTVKTLVADCTSLSSVASPKSAQVSNSSGFKEQRQSILNSVSSPSALGMVESMERSGHSYSNTSSFGRSNRSSHHASSPPKRPFPPRFRPVPSICTWPKARNQSSSYESPTEALPARVSPTLDIPSSGTSPAATAIATANSLGITLVSTHPQLITPFDAMLQQNPPTPGTDNIVSLHTSNAAHSQPLAPAAGDNDNDSSTLLGARHNAPNAHNASQSSKVLVSPSPPEPLNATAIQPMDATFAKVPSVSSGTTENQQSLFSPLPVPSSGPSTRRASPSPTARPIPNVFSPMESKDPTEASMAATNRDSTALTALYIKSEARPNTRVSFCTRVTVVTSTAVAAILTRNAPAAATTRSFRNGDGIVQPVPILPPEQPLSALSIVEPQSVKSPSTLGPIKGAPYSPLLKPEIRPPLGAQSLHNIPTPVTSLPAIRRGSTSSPSVISPQPPPSIAALGGPSPKGRPNVSADAVRSSSIVSESSPADPSAAYALPVAGNGVVSSKSPATDRGEVGIFSVYQYDHNLQLGPTLRPYFINRLLAQYASEEDEDYNAMIASARYSTLHPSPSINDPVSGRDSEAHASMSSAPQGAPPSVTPLIAFETFDQEKKLADGESYKSESISGLLPDISRGEDKALESIGNNVFAEESVKTPTKRRLLCSSTATAPLVPNSTSEGPSKQAQLLFSSSSIKSSLTLFSPIKCRKLPGGGGCDEDAEVAGLADTHTYTGDRATAVSITGSGYATTKEAEGSERRDPDHSSRNMCSSSQLIAAFNGSIGAHSAHNGKTDEGTTKGRPSGSTRTTPTASTETASAFSVPHTVEVESLTNASSVPLVEFDAKLQELGSSFQYSANRMFGSASSRITSPQSCTTPVATQIARVDSVLLLGTNIGRGAGGSPSRVTTPVVTVYSSSPFCPPRPASRAGSSPSLRASISATSAGMSGVSPMFTTSPTATSLARESKPSQFSLTSARRGSIKKDIHPNKATLLARIAVEKEDEANRERMVKECGSDSRIGAFIANRLSPHGRRNSDTGFNRCHSSGVSTKMDHSSASAIHTDPLEPITMYRSHHHPLDPQMHSSADLPISPLESGRQAPSHPLDNGSFCNTETKCNMISAFGSSAGASVVSEFEKQVEEMDPSRIAKLAKRCERLKKKRIMRKARELVQGGGSVTSTSSYPSRENLLQALSTAAATSASSPSPSKLAPIPSPVLNHLTGETAIVAFQLTSASPTNDGDSFLINFSRQNTTTSPMNATNSQLSGLFGIMGPLPSASSVSIAPSAHWGTAEAQGGTDTSPNRQSTSKIQNSEESSDPSSVAARSKAGCFPLPFGSATEGGVDILSYSANGLHSSREAGGLASLFQFSPTALISSHTSSQPTPISPPPQEVMPVSEAPLLKSSPQPKELSPSQIMAEASMRTAALQRPPKPHVHPFASEYAITALVEAPLYDPPANCPHLDQSAKPRGEHLDLFQNLLQKSICGYEEIASNYGEGSSVSTSRSNSQLCNSIHRGYYARTPSALAAALEAHLVRISGFATIDTVTGKTISVWSESARSTSEEVQSSGCPLDRTADDDKSGFMNNSLAADEFASPLDTLPCATGGGMGLCLDPASNCSSQMDRSDRSVTHQFIGPASVPTPLAPPLDGADVHRQNSFEMSSGSHQEFQKANSEEAELVPQSLYMLPPMLPSNVSPTAPLAHQLHSRFIDDSPDMARAYSRDGSAMSALVTPPMKGDGAMEMNFGFPISNRSGHSMDATLPSPRHSLRSLPTCAYVEYGTVVQRSATSISAEMHPTPLGHISSILAQTCSASSNSTARYCDPSCEISMVSNDVPGVLLHPLVVKQSAKVSPTGPSSSSSLIQGATAAYLGSPLDILVTGQPSIGMANTLLPPYRSRVLFEATPGGGSGNANASTMGACSVSDINVLAGIPRPPSK